MKESRIYRLAYGQLCKEIAFEKSKLVSFPNNETVKAKIETLTLELEEITDLIVKAEINECE